MSGACDAGVPVAFGLRQSADVLAGVASDGADLHLPSAAVQRGNDGRPFFEAGGAELTFKTLASRGGSPQLPLLQRRVHGTQRRPLVYATSVCPIGGTLQWPRICGIVHVADSRPLRTI
jgi:hypothetical protein